MHTAALSFAVVPLYFVFYFLFLEGVQRNEEKCRSTLIRSVEL